MYSFAVIFGFVSVRLVDNKCVGLLTASLGKLVDTVVVFVLSSTTGFTCEWFRFTICRSKYKPIVQQDFVNPAHV